MVVCLERGADLHMAQLMPLPLTVSCFSKIQIGFLPFWCRLTWVVPDKGPLNGCVCGVCMSIDDMALVLQQNRLRWYGHVLRKEDNATSMVVIARLGKEMHGV